MTAPGQITWVLKQACRDAASWPGKTAIAVNLSPVQFRNPMLALSVVSALGQSGLAASRLESEIAESILLQADRNVLDALHQFRDLDVRICMDDFGTGDSSLSYLRSFPFDKIKIDRSFIRELSAARFQSGHDHHRRGGRDRVSTPDHRQGGLSASD